MDTTWLNERIAKTKSLIESYEDAETALLAGGIESYTLDTGQSRTVVTKINIAVLRRSIDAGYNRLATLEARLNGGTVQARPAW